MLVVPDLSRFPAELKAKLDAAFRAVKDPQIPVEPDLGDFDDKVKRQTRQTERTTKGKVPVAPDLSKFAPEVRAFIARFDPKEQIKLAATLDRQSFAKTVAEVKALAKAADPKIEVKAEVDRNRFQSLLRKAITPHPELFQALRAPLARGLSTPLGLAITAALTAALGLAIPAAVALGLGGGLIAVGAFALRSSAILKTHFKAAGAAISESLRQAAQPLKGPFLQAVKSITGALLQLQPQFRGLFASLKPAVGALTAGFTGFIREIIPGLQQAMPGINAAFAQFGERLPGLGRTLAGVFAAITSNLPAIEKGVDIFFTFSEVVLNVAGAFLTLTQAASGFFGTITAPLFELRDRLFGVDEGQKAVVVSGRDAANTQGAMAIAAQASATAATALTEKLKPLRQEYREQVAKVRETIQSYQGLITQSGVTAGQVIKDLHNQVTNFRTYSKDVKRLIKEGVSPAAIQELSQKGPQYVHALATGTGTELQRYKRLWKERQAEVKGDFAESLALQFADLKKKIKKMQDEINKLKGREVIVTARGVFKAPKGIVQLPGGGGDFSTKANNRAKGGPIFGPGTGTSDDVPIWASHGEHVWTAGEVAKAGGHHVMEAWRRSIRGYAAGGRVEDARPGAPRPPARGSLSQFEEGISQYDRDVDRFALALGKSLRGRLNFGGAAGASGAVSGVKFGGAAMGYIANFIRKAGVAFQIISGFRPGAVTRGTGSRSLHALGRALDLVGSGKSSMLDIWAAATRIPFRKEVIFSPAPFQVYGRGKHPGPPNNPRTRADHYNHVHVGLFDQGGFLMPGLNLSMNRTGKPEKVTPAGRDAVGRLSFGGQGLHVENLIVQPLSGQFRLRDVMTELQLQGVH